MEVISSNDGILSNAEVLRVIREREASSCGTGGTNSVIPSRQVLELQLSNYFSSFKYDDVPENVSSFITSCRSQGIDLTKAEYLQIINLLPNSVVEIHLIVEECSERLSEEQVDYIVENVKANFRQE